MGFAGMIVSRTTRRTPDRSTSTLSTAALPSGRIVSWDDLDERLSRLDWGKTPAGCEFLDRVRRHLCSKVRMGHDHIWYYNRQNPAWVHGRADMDAKRGPEACYMTGGVLLDAARACQASPVMEQDMAQVVVSLRDFGKDLSLGLLRETRNLAGSYRFLPKCDLKRE